MIEKAFQKNIEKIPEIRKLIVGVSGGPDSVVLAHLLHKAGYEIIIAHLNHGLRGAESDADEQFVQKFAKWLGLPFVHERAELPKEGNLENNARIARYQFLEAKRRAFRADYIAVGHNEDDQIETILLHKERGASLRGLRGMQIVSGFVIRPLLTVPRKNILEYLKEEHLRYREDQTNKDLRLSRNKLRHTVLPKVDRKKVLTMAKESGRTLDRLQKKAKEWFAKNYSEQMFDRASFKKLEKDLSAEILIQIFGAQDLYSKALSQVLDFIKKGQNGKQITVKNKTLVIEYDKIHILSFPPKAEVLPKTAISDTEIHWGNWIIKTNTRSPLFVRAWQTGDRFQPAGMTGTKKLQDYFVDAKIPQQKRHLMPIIVDENDNIVSVGGARFDEKYKELKGRIVIKKM